MNNTYPFTGCKTFCFIKQCIMALKLIETIEKFIAYLYFHVLFFIKSVTKLYILNIWNSLYCMDSMELLKFYLRPNRILWLLYWPNFFCLYQNTYLKSSMFNCSWNKTLLIFARIHVKKSCYTIWVLFDVLRF